MINRCCCIVSGSMKSFSMKLPVKMKGFHCDSKMNGRNMTALIMVL